MFKNGGGIKVNDLLSKMKNSDPIKVISEYYQVDISQWIGISKIDKEEALLLALDINPYSVNKLVRYPLMMIRSAIDVIEAKLTYDSSGNLEESKWCKNINLLDRYIFNRECVKNLKRRIEDKFKNSEIIFKEYIQWLSQLKSKYPDLPIYFQFEELKKMLKVKDNDSRLKISEMIICFLMNSYIKHEGINKKESYKQNASGPIPSWSNILEKEMTIFFGDQNSAPSLRSIREYLKFAQEYHPDDDEIFARIKE